MARDPSFTAHPLGFPWRTRDPFLFCVHHLDRYPAGDDAMGPKTSLSGRRLGMDFDLKDGFRMYHGQRVPGFPAHPHRGFETVTLARQGFIDHSDSLGAKARFGQGDVQWMTAGRGIVHCEMFPLVKPDRANPTELFQIWLNLPARNKRVEPHFSMLWGPRIPQVDRTDAEGRATRLTLIAGAHPEVERAVPAPPPASWAAQPDADVAIWTLAMAPGARFTLPPIRPGTLRTLYFFSGERLELSGRPVDRHGALELDGEGPAPLVNGPAPSELLLLQGRPIGEPVAQHGPFVMNTREELAEAYRDFQHTQFGGWPWPSAEPVHPRTQGRFALHPDGRLEYPEAV